MSESNGNDQKRQVAEELGRWLAVHASEYAHGHEPSIGKPSWNEDQHARYMFSGAYRTDAFRILFDAHEKGWQLPGSDWIEGHFTEAWSRHDRGADCRALFTEFRPTWDAWRFALETAAALRAEEEGRP